MIASTSSSSAATAMRSLSRVSSSRLLPTTASTCTPTSTLRALTPTTPSSVRSTLTPPTLRSPVHPHPYNHRFFSSSASRHNNEGVKKMTSGEEEIYTLLVQRFAPQEVQVQDVSGGCGSFYSIVIACKEFNGLKTVKQHMLVNQCLKDVISGIHGLQLKTIPVE